MAADRGTAGDRGQKPESSRKRGGLVIGGQQGYRTPQHSSRGPGQKPESSRKRDGQVIGGRYERGCQENGSREERGDRHERTSRRNDKRRQSRGQHDGLDHGGRRKRLGNELDGASSSHVRDGVSRGSIWKENNGHRSQQTPTSRRLGDQSSGGCSGSGIEYGNQVRDGGHGYTRRNHEPTPLNDYKLKRMLAMDPTDTVLDLLKHGKQLQDMLEIRTSVKIT